MNIIIKKTGAVILAGALLSLPFLAAAQVEVPCKGPDCGFNQLIMLINNVIKFTLFSVAIPLAAIGIMFAGARMTLNPANPGVRSDAIKTFQNIGIGFAVFLSAFLIVKLILYQFLNTRGGFTLFLLQ